MPLPSSFTQATITQLQAHLQALSRRVKPRGVFDLLDARGQAVVFLSIFGVILCVALDSSEYLVLLVPVSVVALAICGITAKGSSEPPQREFSIEQIGRLKGVIHLLELLARQHGGDDRLDLTVDLDEELMLRPDASATTAWCLIVGELDGASYRARLVGSEGVSRVEVDLDVGLPGNVHPHRAAAALHEVDPPEGFAANTIEPRGQAVRVGLVSRERHSMDDAAVATAAALSWRDEAASEAKEAEGAVYR
jgi:hypothetical protein